jgi:hypothetical protein
LAVLIVRFDPQLSSPDRCVLSFTVDDVSSAVLSCSSFS